MKAKNKGKGKGKGKKPKNKRTESSDLAVHFTLPSVRACPLDVIAAVVCVRAHASTRAVVQLSEDRKSSDKKQMDGRCRHIDHQIRASHS